jgi:hypothetical protein
MVRPLVWALATWLVLAGGAWNSAIGLAYDLSKLKSICVDVGELSTAAKQKFGLSREDIGNQVYVWLKSKLPKLQVKIYTEAKNEMCSIYVPTMWIYVNLGIVAAGGESGYYGSVHLTLTRKTRWESGKVGAGIAYNKQGILTGPTKNARNAVFKILADLLTDFAAEYHKARGK